MKGVGIYSPRCGVFEPLRPVDGLELIAAVQRILGRESPDCYRVLRWARILAEGRSFREYCREAGKTRSTNYHRLGRALRRIADTLNQWAAARAVGSRPGLPIADSQDDQARDEPVALPASDATV